MSDRDKSTSPQHLFGHLAIDFRIVGSGQGEEGARSVAVAEHAIDMADVPESMLCRRTGCSEGAMTTTRAPFRASSGTRRAATLPPPTTRHRRPATEIISGTQGAAGFSGSLSLLLLATYVRITL